MIKILVASGVNLDLLGVREPEVYGTKNLSDMEHLLKARVRELSLGPKVQIDFFQSNDISKYLSILDQKYQWTILNPGAWTHTSLALRDRILGLGIDIIEVHCSKPSERESFREFSYIKDIAIKNFSGNGIGSYLDALNYILLKHHFIESN